MKEPKPRVELITSFDHWSSSGWVGKKEIKNEALLIRHVGYFVNEDKEYVYLAGIRADDGAWGDIRGVFKKAIVNRKRLGK